MQVIWRSRDAQMLVQQTGEPDPVSAIVKKARDLIDDTSIAQPPFPPRILASFQGIQDVRPQSMSGAARLVPERGKLFIDVNRDHSIGKQNFSADHETSHTLLPTYALQS